MDDPSSSLALALSGFAVSAATANSLPQRRGARHSKLRTVTTSLAPLIKHAQVLGAQLISGPSSQDYQQLVEQLESLCFGLRSTLGLSGQLPEEEAEQIWELSTKLWEASLHQPARQAEPLAKLAKELFELRFEGECDKSEECAAFVSFFAKMAKAWAKLGNQEQAGWCIERAMRYSEQLEAMLHSAEVPQERQESAVVQLFSLYIEAAKNATDTRQKALANNLVSRAVQLSRHDSVSPDSSVSMCISITQLQLQQAQAMAESETMLAVALLTAAYQQLIAAEQPAAESSSAQLQEGVTQLKQEVILQLCKAHLQAGDAKMAAKCMENLDASATANLAPDAQLMVVRVHMEAGKVAEALQFLVSIMPGADMTGGEVSPGLRNWLACLKLALPAATQEGLPAFQSVVASYIWKATSTPDCFLLLLQTLLSIDQGNARQGCQRMALEMLASEEVSMSIHKDKKVQQEVHAVLWHTAVQLFSSSEPAAARELFSAAFHYAQLAGRPKNARMLSACHTQLGQHQRAAEYLDIAAREEQQRSYMTQIMRLQAFINLRRHAEAVEVLKSLPTCPDFHTSCVGIACATASKAEDPTVAKEAAAMAVQVLIKPDSPDSSRAAGEEGCLLLEYASAVRLCIQRSAGEEATSALYKELASVIRLATKRLALITPDRFAGKDKAAVLDSLGRHAYNGGLQAYRAKALEACVMLLSSSCMLLKEMPGQQHSEGGVAQQARALMAASQALLDLHSSGTGGDRAGRLLLAQKLLSKVQELVAALPVGQHTDVRQCYLTLAAMVGCQLPEEGSVVQAVEDLAQSSSPISVPRCKAILSQLSGRRQQSDRLRACLYSLAARSVQQAGSTAEGLGLAAALLQACPSPSHMSQLLQACCHLMQHHNKAATTTAATSSAAPSPEERAARQWLVCQAWNQGTELGKGGHPELEEALLQLALEMLHAGGSPAELSQARQLEGALVAWRGARSQAAAPAASHGPGAGPPTCEVAGTVESLQPLAGPGRGHSQELHVAACSEAPSSQAPATLQQAPLSMDPSQAGMPDSRPQSAEPPEEPAGASPCAAAMAVDNMSEQQAEEAEHAAASMLQAEPQADAHAAEEAAISEAGLPAPAASQPSGSAAADDAQPEAAAIGAGSASVGGLKGWPAISFIMPELSGPSAQPAQGFNIPALNPVGAGDSQSEDEGSQGSQGDCPSWLDAINAARKLCDDRQRTARQQPKQPPWREPPAQQERQVKRQTVAAGAHSVGDPIGASKCDGGQAAGPLYQQAQQEQQLSWSSELDPDQPSKAAGTGSLQEACAGARPVLEGDEKQGRWAVQAVGLEWRQGGCWLGIEGVEELSLEEDDDLMRLD